MPQPTYNPQNKKPKFRLDDIVVDPKFEKEIPPLSEEEFQGLENDIIENGCRHPITLWPRKDGKAVIVDGHNRYKICMEHGIPFQYTVVECKDEDDAMLQLYNMQLNRRNLPDFVRGKIVWKRHDLVEQVKENNRRRMLYGKKIPESLPEAQEDKDVLITSPTESSEEDGTPFEEYIPPLEDTREQEKQGQENKTAEVQGIPITDPRYAGKKTRDILGEEAGGLSGETMRQIKVIMDKEVPDDVQDLIVKRNDEKLSVHNAYKLANMPEDIQNEAYAAIRNKEKNPKDIVKEAEEKAKDRVREKSQYLQTARNVMGSADFDPTDRDIPDKSGKVRDEDYGATREWIKKGNVFLDISGRPSKIAIYVPPFKGFVKEKQRSNEQLIFVLPSDTSADWFSDMIAFSSAVCFVRGKKHLVFYFGDQVEKFCDAFREYGAAIPLEQPQLEP